MTALNLIRHLAQFLTKDSVQQLQEAPASLWKPLSTPIMETRIKEGMEHFVDALNIHRGAEAQALLTLLLEGETSGTARKTPTLRGAAEAASLPVTELTIPPLQATDLRGTARTVSPPGTFTTISTPAHISRDLVMSLLVGAMESGSRYWMGWSIVKDAIYDKAVTAGLTNENGDLIYRLIFDHHGSLEVWDGEGKYDDGEDYLKGIISVETLDKGLRLMAEKHDKHFNDVVADNTDAGTADALIQLAAFGEIHFG